MRKLLREARIILPIGTVGSILLIICTYVFKAICYILEKLGSFFENDGVFLVAFYIIEKLSGFFEEDGFILVALGIFTIAFAIKWVYTADQKED